MHIANYLALVHNSEQNLNKAYQKVSKQHAFDPDVSDMCEKFARWSSQHIEYIKRFQQEFENEGGDEGEAMPDTLFKPRMGSFGLLRDLHELWVLAHDAEMCWIILLQSAKALRHKELEEACVQCGLRIEKETLWMMTKIKHAAPQAMVVAQ